MNKVAVGMQEMSKIWIVKRIWRRQEVQAVWMKKIGKVEDVRMRRTFCRNVEN